MYELASFPSNLEIRLYVNKLWTYCEAYIKFLLPNCGGEILCSFTDPHIKFPLHRVQHLVVYGSCETTQNFPSLVMEGEFCVLGRGKFYVTTHIKFPLHGRSKMSFCVTVYITISSPHTPPPPPSCSGWAPQKPWNGLCPKRSHSLCLSLPN